MYFSKYIFTHILSYIINPNKFFKDGSIHYISYLDITGHPRIDMIEIVRMNRRWQGDTIYSSVEYNISTMTTNQYNLNQSISTVNIEAPVYVCTTHGMERFVLNTSWQRSGKAVPIWLYSLHTQDRSRAFEILLSRLDKDSDIFENVLEFCYIAHIF